jgi:N-acetylmuramoyl-L-alanine amidase
MTFNSIVISSGHGLYVRGASGIIDEVDEARTFTDVLANELRHRGIDVKTYHDDVSQSQSENLNRITDYHNAQVRDLDISVHFNAYTETEDPRGCEVLYVTQSKLASVVSETIADAGNFIDRGPKKRTDLHFLNACAMPAILLEVCFVDSEADCELYRANFKEIIASVANLTGDITDEDLEDNIEEPIPPEQGVVVRKFGKVSWFGGPDDMGVSEDEGLAFIYDIMDAPYLFLPYQPEGTTGLARRLNPFVHYIACRWNYDVMSKPELLDHVALVRNTKTGKALKAFPADWGPHSSTDRLADISPGLMEDLELTTDDEVEVIFPWKE